MNNYFVYITTNPGRTVLYTGVTNDLERRLFEHFEDRGGRKVFPVDITAINLFTGKDMTILIMRLRGKNR